MKKAPGFWFVLAVLALSGCFSSAAADGLLLVEPPPGSSRAPAPQALPVKYHRVQVSIENQVATTSIDQVFRNESGVDLEGTYIFPLPEEAAISEFVLYMDGQPVRGQVLDKERARQTYEDIVRRMRDPGLLEYAGRNMFRARIYPVPKHGESRIELRYQQTLRADHGLFKYVYPLNTEKFSPKPLQEVSIGVKIRAKQPIKSVYSPSHEIDSRLEEFTASAGYEAKNVRPEKDFVLYYSVSDKEIGLDLVTHRRRGEDGFFMMLMSPGQFARENTAKDIIFVLDTSGSMLGEKLAQAKQALRFCINKLSGRDRFNVLGFATDIHAFRPGLVSAETDNVQAALSFIDRLEAAGGTNINESLTAALKMFGAEKRVRMLVFLTDGEATVGVTDMQAILKNAGQANHSRARVFVFGVGHDVNSHLLDKLSEEQRGVAEYVAANENLEIKLGAFYGKVSDPVLSDLKLDFGPLQVKEVYPRTLPDLFKGQQLVLIGRYQGQGAAVLDVAGHLSGAPHKLSFETRFPEEAQDNDFIPRIWATRKIGYLMNEIRLRGENAELKEEIIKLSKEHGIMTPYTSFLVIEQERDLAASGAAPSSALRFEEISGMARDLGKGASFGRAMQQAVGAQAIEGAQDIRRLKEGSISAGSRVESVKQVGRKTFYLQGDTWIDSNYRETMRLKEVGYLSADYFALLKNKPELARFFALGEKVMVVLEGECFKVA